MVSRYLTDEEIARLLGVMSYRMALACEVARHTGLRIEDVLELKRADIECAKERHGHVTVTELKTGKRRSISLTAELLRRMEVIGGQRYIFEGRGGVDTHLSRSGVWRAVKRAAAVVLDNTNGVSPHSLRKSYAVDMYRRCDGDMDKVRRKLNHDDESVTMLYALSDKLAPAKRKQSKRGLFGGRRGKKHKA